MQCPAQHPEGSESREGRNRLPGRIVKASLRRVPDDETRFQADKEGRKFELHAHGLLLHGGLGRGC